MKTEAVHQLHAEALKHLDFNSYFSVYNFELIARSKMLPLYLYRLRNEIRKTNVFPSFTEILILNIVFQICSIIACVLAQGSLLTAGLKWAGTIWSSTLMSN